MKSKKLLLILPLLIFAFTAWLFFHSTALTSPPQAPLSISKTARISIVYDSSTTTNAQVNLTASSSALNLLEDVVHQANIPLQTKKYSFGTLVEAINNLKNTPEKAWIYFINSKSASVGADQYLVQPGDFIEWKYVTPQF